MHVPEGLECGNELHMMGCCVSVELADARGGEGGGIGADVGMRAETKGMLGVEHQRVQFESRAQIDDSSQRGEGGYLPSGDVDQDAPQGEIRCILDAACRDHSPRSHQLHQGLDGIAKAGRTFRLNLDPLGAYPQSVRLPPRSPTVELDAWTEVFGSSVCLNGQLDSRVPEHPFLKHQSGSQVPIGGARGEHDGKSAAEIEATAKASHLFWRGKKRWERNRLNGGIVTRQL